MNHRFDGRVHLRYSQIEEVEYSEQLKHDIVRETLKILGIRDSIEIVTISDIPTRGSGLGSSSTLTVGLLKALFAWIKKDISVEELAKLACEVEINILKSPIGKQDQYAASYGGFRRYTFEEDGKVSIHKFAIKDDITRLEVSSMLLYLGYTRQANGILRQHKNNITSKEICLENIKSIASYFELCLHCGVQEIGNSINASWNLKKKMSDGYSSDDIDNIIRKAISAGAVGAKLVGAGGGGFMLIICELVNQNNVRTTLSNLKELKFRFHDGGSEVIFDDTIS